MTCIGKRATRPRPGAVAILVGVGVTTPVLADGPSNYWDRWWGIFGAQAQPFDFHDESYWSEQSVPGPGETAFFDWTRVSPEPNANSAWVVFSEDWTTDRLRVREGVVGLDLQGHTYTLTNMDPVTDPESAALMISGTVEDALASGLRIADGTLTAPHAGLAYDGESFAGPGVLTVREDATLEVAERLTIGQSGLGRGRLRVNEGGTAQAMEVHIGVEGDGEAEGAGDAIVAEDGSTLDVLNELYVGIHDEGQLTIEEGGQVDSIIAYIGDQTLEPDHRVTVDGEGSTWNNTAAILVGHEGGGALDITDGGQVNSMGGMLGMEEGAEGSVAIVGDEATWDATVDPFDDFGNGGFPDGDFADDELSNGGGGFNGDFPSNGDTSPDGAVAVGMLGKGDLTVAHGSTLISDLAAVAIDEDAQGEVTITGAEASWENEGLLMLASLGEGEIIVEDGGELTSSHASIGGGPGADGSMTIRGQGARWHNDHWLAVGGAPDIDPDAMAPEHPDDDPGGSPAQYMPAFADDIDDSDPDASPSEVRVVAVSAGCDRTDSSQSTSISLTANNENNEQDPPPGVGSLTVQEQGRATAGQMLHLEATGDVIVESGGAVAVALPGDDELEDVDDDTLALFEDGQITGFGTITADTTTNAGIIAPGVPGDPEDDEAGPDYGVLTLDADYVQDPEGELLIRIESDEPGHGHDQLNILGDASFDGTLIIDHNDYEPVVGDAFNILNFANSADMGTGPDEFTTLEYTGFADSDLQWDDSDLYTQGVIRVVPEPGSLALLGAGGLLLMRRKRQEVLHA